eukprot:TRINITY_DN5797_c0_g1_i22.p1 TRINITY_DN5797_c0_g1~~TRINITY_DN5797_c0_g1_i22.p1  ORF type:complete len:307 (+),score=52.29 TRINITY_DN5797_c0_g1_i22:158-1078(+)
MSNKKAFNVKDKAKFYGWVALLSTVRTSVGFPMEQPLEISKTIWQAEPCHRNEFALVKSIYSRFGFAGFYRGALANYTRIAIKSLYRYPLLMLCQGIFDRIFPGMERSAKSLALVKGLTAFSVANIESVIVCPLERIKVFFMTRTVFKGGYFQYLKANSHFLTRELFRGLWIHMLRQNVSWFVWLETDAWTKMHIRRKYNIDPYKQTIPFRLMLPLALVTSVVNVLAVMPFDMVKTNLQKEKPESVIKLLKTYAKGSNVKYFFVGWRLRLLQYFIQNVFTMNMLETMEIQYRKLKQKYIATKQSKD